MSGCYFLPHATAAVAGLGLEALKLGKSCGNGLASDGKRPNFTHAGLSGLVGPECHPGQEMLVKAYLSVIVTCVS